MSRHPSHVRLVAGEPDLDLEERKRADQRRVLLVLARAPFPMKRRAIEEAAFGATGHMVWRTVEALHALADAGYVEDAYNPRTGQFHRCYRATAKGLAEAPGVEVFHPGGAS